MARIHGEPFVSWVRDETSLEIEDTARVDDSALDVGRVRHAFAQLVTGVRAIHAAGRIHRDLKPSNVLVDRDGHVVILDFGLAEDHGGDTTKSVERAGTPAYMAPEQLTMAGACEASDWYAVGVMLYEVLTGRRPYEGSVRELLRAKMEGRPPVDPTALAGDVPPDLAKLAMELLRAAPPDRPAAEKIASHLGGEAAPRSLRRPAVFLGRTSELERLKIALAGSRMARRDLLG